MQRFVRCFLVLMIACSFVSVFLSSVFLGLATLCWLLDCAQNRRVRLAWPPYVWAVAIFAGLVVLAIVFSSDVLLSMRYLKKFFHFFAAVLVFTYFDRKLLKLTGVAVAAIAVISALVGVYQYFVLHRVSLLGRATGLMSHWMTFSGQLMIVGIVLTACLVAVTSAGARGSAFGAWLSRWNRGGALLAGGLALVLLAMVLTLTRSAWVGCSVGVIILLGLRSWRLVLAGLAVFVLIGVAFPQRFSQRLSSSFDSADYTNRVRVELLRTGIKVIKAHPYMGIGPRVIAKDYVAYRVSDEFPGFAYQHLHNNLVQVAAEMGLFALVAWLGMWAKIAWDHVRLMRRARTRTHGDAVLFWMAGAALATLAAFLAAGLFEYNFGDSEILTLLLFVLTAPYVWAKTQPPETPQQAGL